MANSRSKAAEAAVPADSPETVAAAPENEAQAAPVPPDPGDGPPPVAAAPEAPETTGRKRGYVKPVSDTDGTMEDFAVEPDPLAEAISESIADPEERLSEFIVADDEEAETLTGDPGDQPIVPIAKPSKQKTFCISADPSHVLTVNVYFVDQDQDENGENMYLISPRYVPLVEESVRKVQLRLYVMPDGIYGLLPIKMTKNEKGRMYPQPASMLKVAAKYAGKWIRVKYVKALKVYQGVPMDVAVEPKFPEIPMMEIVNRAYEDRLINRRDHPILVDQVGPGA